VPLVGRFADLAAAAAADFFWNEPAPHKAPEVVRTVLSERYLEFDGARLCRAGTPHSGARFGPRD
jgi:hypothetical protein